ncbi:MAG: polysaccharide biosynthesis protein [Pseudomonadota bacterium]
MFENKKLLITGGTGSFGNAVLRRFLETDVEEIRILSRDEKKQDDARRHYNNPKLRFFIGDVRDRDSVMAAMRGVDHVFNAAALKQVPSCEFHPMEAVKTNIYGVENVAEAAIRCGVQRLICLSTDKAVYPVNAMGMSKALMEKVFVAKARNALGSETVICGTRYGNVMASRGSVIPLFVSQVLAGKPITITDPSMTRFMMTLDDAVDLVLFAFETGEPGDIFVQKAPAATLDVLAKAICELLEVPEHPVQIIGTRHGEKKHETLLNREERVHSREVGRYFQIKPDFRDLNYQAYTDVGESEVSEVEDYNSANTERLDVEGMKALLMKLPLMHHAIEHRHVDGLI